MRSGQRAGREARRQQPAFPQGLRLQSLDVRVAEQPCPKPFVRPDIKRRTPSDTSTVAARFQTRLERHVVVEPPSVSLVRESTRHDSAPSLFQRTCSGSRPSFIGLKIGGKQDDAATARASGQSEPAEHNRPDSRRSEPCGRSSSRRTPCRSRTA